MPKSHYDTGFPNEVTIKDIPVLNMQTWDSKAFWVDSEKGSDSNKGNVKYPFKTLEEALEHVTANNGDQIYIAPGHAETISDATTIVIATAGVQIIGLGVGNSRPTFTFSTATASVVINAADTYINNIIFLPSYNGVANFIYCNAKRIVLRSCYFNDGSLGEYAINQVTVEGSSDNACDGIKFIECEFYSSNADAAIYFNEQISGVYILDCIGIGEFTNAIIYNPVGIDAQIQDIFIEGGIYDSVTTDPTFLLNQDVSGHINRDVMFRNSESFGDTYITAHIGRGINGDAITFKKIVAATDFVTAGADISLPSLGDLYIEKAVVDVGSSAVATATNLQIGKTGSYGVAVFWEEAVASLTANTSFDLTNASVVGTQTVLEAGETLRISSTGADATGAGFLAITIVFRRLVDGATIQPTP